jgi:hypothetical protein
VARRAAHDRFLVRSHGLQSLIELLRLEVCAAEIGSLPMVRRLGEARLRVFAPVQERTWGRRPAARPRGRASARPGWILRRARASTGTPSARGRSNPDPIEPPPAPDRG